jgi:hypothetical protein
MVTRRIGALIRFGCTVAGIAVLESCAPGGDNPLPPGLSLPPTLLSQAAPVQIVWVLRPEDYLTCQNAAHAVRILQRHYREALTVSVIYNGPRPEWVVEFLRQQRITAEFAPLGRREFHAVFGRRPPPAIYLVHRARVVDVLPGTGSPRVLDTWKSRIDELVSRDADIE